MKLYKLIILFFTIALLCSTCSPDQNSNATFRLVPSSESGLDFQNNLPVDLSLNILNYMYYYNGGGTAVADINNDTLPDVIFTSNLGPDKVFLNEGNLKFRDVSEVLEIKDNDKSWTNGVAVADVNGDGLQDIYLSQVGDYRELDCHNLLFICQSIDDEGIPSYTESSKEYGLDFVGFSTQAGFFDYDVDGDLDMFLMNHSLHHNGTFGQRTDFLGTYDSISGDRLYRNDRGKFTDVTESSGIHSSVIGYGLGLAFGDFNDDNYPDIYIGNDFHENDYLYINQKDGTFLDQLESKIKHTSRFSMGVDVADIDNDLDDDIISLDMLPDDPYILKASEGEDALDIFNFKLGYGYNHQYARNALQLNEQEQNFKEVAAYSNIHATDWSWTPLIFDFEMDGKKDVFITNGIPKRMNDIDYINFISGKDVQYKIQFDQLEQKDLSVIERIPEIKLLNKFYRQSDNLTFEELKGIANHVESYSNSAAYADFDLDGDYDVICNNIDADAFLYENVSNSSSVSIHLRGPAYNRNGVGARVIATYTDGTQRGFNNYLTKGFQSCMISDILIPSENLSYITVKWSGGKTTKSDYSGEKRMEISFDDIGVEESTARDSKSSVITARELSNDLGIDFKHKENPFVEFNREPLIPFSTSSDGPALAVADVNGDGLQDFYVGSSKRKRSRLYIQNETGFELTSVTGLPSDTIYEEVDAKFVDIDKDGDQDLVIATGGNEYRLNSPYTRPLLYKNEGGILSRDTSAFLGIHGTFSCVVAHDFNGDGNTDLFFGGRAVPRSYGDVPRSYLLINNGDGRYTDMTEDYFGKIELGFVTDAVVANIDGDDSEELLIAYEWSEIRCYKVEHNKFEEKEISNEKGWWSCLVVEDIDGDGDQDIFAGNLGLNSRLKASSKYPVRMYYNDFDNNGTAEQILTYVLNGARGSIC